QMELVRQTVRSYRDHPALLMWALGNETELDASAEDRLLVWNAIEQLAAVVKQEDPNHPVITVIAGGGGGKVAELAEHCPTLDAIGVNAYGGASQIPEALARQGWNKPYLVTEFGPRGHWEVEKTPWDLPIEDDSTTKAAHYLESYEKAVLDQSNCLGSYVFLWGDKQEKTHTWYGMFLPDGSPTAAMDVMTYVWSGKRPINRAPEIGPARVTLTPERATRGAAQQRFQVGSTVHAHVDATDPEDDPLIVKWDVRRDVAGVDSRGGDPEEPTPIIQESVRAKRFTRAVIQIPDEPGNYRIFVYVYDPKGSVATTNVPIVAVEGR
ncbi:MAG: hypothetical protein GY953_29955, partial [bacterium]|nr:hypothetical protein [bacterium]